MHYKFVKFIIIYKKIRKMELIKIRLLSNIRQTGDTLSETFPLFISFSSYIVCILSSC